MGEPVATTSKASKWKLISLSLSLSPSHPLAFSHTHTHTHTHKHTHTHTHILFASYSMLFLFYVTKVSLGPTSLQDQWNNISIQAAVTHILGFSPTCSQNTLGVYLEVPLNKSNVKQCSLSLNGVHRVPITSVLSLEARGPSGVWWNSREALESLDVLLN